MRFLSSVLIGFLLWPFEAATFMVAVGIVHGEWLTTMPTVGFGPSMLITAALGLFAVAWRLPDDLAEEWQK
jgi:hypothetical protein